MRVRPLVNLSTVTAKPGEQVTLTGTGTLALVALGVDGVGMFAAGVAALGASRRGGVTAAPSRVKK